MWTGVGCAMKPGYLTIAVGWACWLEKCVVYCISGIGKIILGFGFLKVINQIKGSLVNLSSIDSCQI